MKKLSNFEISDFIEKNGMKCETELLAIANEQKQKSEKDLADFILSRKSRSLNDFFSKHGRWIMTDRLYNVRKGHGWT